MTIQTTTMTLTQARDVARSVHAIRRDWDRPGIEDALARARHLADAASVAVAAHRAAANHANRTPAIIALDGPHWRDAAKPPHFPGPTSRERCSTCSEREDRCRTLWAGDHAFTPDLRSTAGKADAQVAHLRALRDETTADFCSHGVDRRQCVEHRPAKASETTPGEIA